jgi:hypothetical protein
MGKGIALEGSKNTKLSFFSLSNHKTHKTYIRGFRGLGGENEFKG